MLGRVKDAVADAAETLRRAFAGVAVGTLAPEPFRPRGQGFVPLAGAAGPGLAALRVETRTLGLLREAVEGRGLDPFQAVLQAEAGWARWGAEATVVRMEPLEAGRAEQVRVPPLPGRPGVRAALAPLPDPGQRRWLDGLVRPGTRRVVLGPGPGVAVAGLEAMLSLPVPIPGEDIQRLPKGLWMRYSLQLVRETGENVRNLEVLGLFRIPRKGVADLRHDPRSRRILIRLELGALRSPRAPFILARRKDDGGLVSCFVEDP